MTDQLKKISILLFVGILMVGLKNTGHAWYFQQTQPPDTAQAKTDTSRYVKSPYPVFGLQRRYGDPLTRRMLRSPLLFNSPGYLNRNIRLDSANNYIFSEQLGGNFLRPPTLLPFRKR